MLTPVQVDAPPDDPEPDDLKPPDWCGVPGDVGPRSPVGVGTDLGNISPAAMVAVTQATLDAELAAVGSQGDGVEDTGYCPADPTIAAGPSHLLVGVESTVASYSKGSPPTEQWRTPLAHWLEPLQRDLLGDASRLLYYHPSVVYDELDGRFLLTVAAVDAVTTGELAEQDLVHPDLVRLGVTSMLFVGVSEGSSPDGTWCFGAIPTPGFAHYPRIGYNDDYLFVTNNEYAPLDAGPLWSSVYTIPKSGMLSCGAVAFRAFIAMQSRLGAFALYIRPAATAGSEPYYLLSADQPFSGPGTSLTLWAFEEGLPLQPQTILLPPAKPYSMPFAAREDCEPVPSVRYLDVLDNRLHNVVYQDGMLWASQVSRSFALSNKVVVYEIDIAKANDPNLIDYTPDVHEIVPEGTIDRHSFFNPAVMVDPDGDMVVAFNSNGTQTAGADTASTADDAWARRPAVWTRRWLAGESGWRVATQRKGSDTCYTHPPQPPPPLGSGQDGQVGSPYRWGESTGIALDPDGSGAWVYGVYSADVYDIYVRDRLEGTTEVVTLDSDATLARHPCIPLRPMMSGDGRFVGFTCLSENGHLVPGNPNTDLDVFLRDRRLGTTEVVSVPPQTRSLPCRSAPRCPPTAATPRSPPSPSSPTTTRTTTPTSMSATGARTWASSAWTRRCRTASLT